MSKFGEAKEHILTLLDDIEGGDNFHPCYESTKFLTEMRESINVIEYEHNVKIGALAAFKAAFQEKFEESKKMENTLRQIQSIAVKSTSVDPNEFGSLLYQILMALSIDTKEVK